MNSNASGIASNALASTDTSGNIGNLSNRFALDVQGFDAMRAQANASPQQGLKAAAKQFDAVFTQMMLKSMRDATPSDSPFDSNESKSFTSMLDQQLSQQMTSKGIGVADMMLKQLMRTTGGAGASGAAGATGAAGALGTLSADGDSSANAGNLAAMNAMAKAYANAAASKGKSLQSGTGYGANSALEPPARGNGSDSVERIRRPARGAGAGRERRDRHSGALHHRPGGAGIGLGQARDQACGRLVEPQHLRRQGDARTGPATPVNATTTEYVNGQPKKVVERFRAYDSYEDALTDYASVLKNNPRYAPVVQASRDAAGFAHGMQKAGYATDPQYAKKLISIMRQIV